MKIMLGHDGVCEAVESSILRVSGSGPMEVQAVASIAVREKMLMTPVAKFVAEQTKKEVFEVAQQSVLFALPSPPHHRMSRAHKEKSGNLSDTESRRNVKEL